MTASNDLNISQVGFQSFDGTATFSGRTLTAGAGVIITNGNGVAGNPVIALQGGGGAVEHLTGDTGGQLNPDGANNFNLFGQLAGSTTVFDTIGSGSTVSFENRAWTSRYVVDTSATVGLRGTYATLQAAITQAIADGATGVGATIFVRNCTINETITVNTASVNITITGTGGIDLQNTGAAMPVFSGTFTNSGAGSAIAFKGFNISGTLATSTGIYIDDSLISGTLTITGGGMIVTNCFGSSETLTCSGNITFAGCSLSGTHTYSGAAAPLYNDSVFSGSLAGSTSGALQIINSYVPLNTNTMTAGKILITGAYYGAQNFFSNSSVTYSNLNGQQGNTLTAVRSAVSYVALANQDYYIGITDTSAARTVTLPNVSVIKNQSFIIKDEGGGAGAHNITISVNGGVKTIDGQASYVISVNYGAVSLIYDGTNFFSF